jgi:hypothetical protein
MNSTFNTYDPINQWKEPVFRKFYYNEQSLVLDYQCSDFMFYSIIFEEPYAFRMVDEACIIGFESEKNDWAFISNEITWGKSFPEIQHLYSEFEKPKEYLLMGSTCCFSILSYDEPVITHHVHH